MQIKKLLMVITICSFITKAQDKYIIGTGNGRGFFAGFFVTLGHLQWCERNNKKPMVFWDKNSLYYQSDKGPNAWEYYFYPVSDAKYENEPISRDHEAPDQSEIFLRVSNPNLLKNQNFRDKIFSLTKKDYREKINKLINKFIKLRPEIKNKIDNFYEKNMKGKKLIGIHIRGTDKRIEVPQIPLSYIFSKANEFHGYEYFVASDEQSILEAAKRNLRGKVISYDAFRSQDGWPVHYNNAVNDYYISRGDNAQHGEEVLIEAYLLSKCEKLIHTWSYVSCGVLSFNPNLESILLLP